MFLGSPKGRDAGSNEDAKMMDGCLRVVLIDSSLSRHKNVCGESRHVQVVVVTLACRTSKGSRTKCF